MKIILIKINFTVIEKDTVVFYLIKINAQAGTVKENIYADETILKVINDNGKSSKFKKYMWLYMSETNKKLMILYNLYHL